MNATPPRHRPTAATFAASLLLGASMASMADCKVRSGAKTSALVELYTSEGCSSCPPADAQMRALPAALAADAEFVPVALHVDYWDYIGWKDPYAKTNFGERQRWLAGFSQQPLVYTPQFFVGGDELRAWRGRLRDQVQAVNARPAAAAIRIHATLQGDAALAVRVAATASASEGPASLFLALTENGLASTVTAGENSGRTLSHDHIVRTWIGPLALADGGVRWTGELPIPARANRAKLAVVAFVQSAQSGRVLQALSAHQCATSGAPLSE